MPLLPVALYTALAFLFGLWQVGWSLERLPLWFYAYALLVGVFSALTFRLPQLDHAQRPFWQRVGLRGSSVLPIMALLSVDTVLSQPAHLGRLAAACALVLLLSGLFSLWLDRKSQQGSRGARVLKDWF